MEVSVDRMRNITQRQGISSKLSNGSKILLLLLLLLLLFSAPVQTDPGTHPSSYTMGTGSFQGVKRPGSGFYHPPNLTPMLKKE